MNLLLNWFLNFPYSNCDPRATQKRKENLIHRRSSFCDFFADLLTEVSWEMNKMWHNSIARSSNGEFAMLILKAVQAASPKHSLNCRGNGFISDYVHLIMLRLSSAEGVWNTVEMNWTTSRGTFPIHLIVEEQRSVSNSLITMLSPLAPLHQLYKDWNSRPVRTLLARKRNSAISNEFAFLLSARRWSALTCDMQKV